MKKYALFLALAVFVSSRAITEELSPPLDGLVAGWDRKEPAVYKYHLKAGGVFGYSNIRISVGGGECTANSQYVYGKTKTRWKSGSCEGRTIKELIESVQAQEREGVKESDMAINAKYSFVSYYSALPNNDLTDQDWYFEVTDFKVK